MTTAPLTPQTIPIADIELDSSLQTRSDLHRPTIEAYADIIDDLPPIVCVQLPDDGPLVLVSGWHRLAAHRAAGRTTISAIIDVSDMAGARQRAASANARHGLPLTTAEKRRACELYLTDNPPGSCRDIAKILGVSHNLVAEVRAELHPPSSHDDQSPLVALGTPPAHLSPANDRRWRLLTYLGQCSAMPTAAEITAATGLTATTITAACKAGYISHDTAAGTTDALAYALAQKGCTWLRDVDQAACAARSPAPTQPSNLLSALRNLVALAAEDDEPLCAKNAADELNTDTATILALASSHPDLRVTEREVGDDRLPAVELVPPATVPTSQPHNTSLHHADESDESDESAPIPTAPYRRYLMRRVGDHLRTRRTITARAALAYLLMVGIEGQITGTVVHRAMAGQPSDIYDLAQESVAEDARETAENEDLAFAPQLLSWAEVAASDIGLDWPALITEANAKFY
jgi:hypothetical protein